MEPLTRRAIYERRRKIVRPKPNRDKLRELILYIAFRSEADERFGKTKLYKLLFHADFLSFLKFGHPITGYEYEALKNGPAPKHIKQLLDEMHGSQLVIRPTDFYGRIQHKPIWVRKPDIDKKFKAHEIALVDELIQKNWTKTATEMSEESHLFFGWQFAKRGQTIPYSTALVSRRMPTPAEIEHGRSLEPLARERLARHASKA